jgi:hypothetical protein
MSRNFFDPTPEEQQIVLIEEAGLRKAEKLIESCRRATRKALRFPSITSSTG